VYVCVCACVRVSVCVCVCACVCVYARELLHFIQSEFEVPQLPGECVCVCVICIYMYIHLIYVCAFGVHQLALTQPIEHTPSIGTQATRTRTRTLECLNWLVKSTFLGAESTTTHCNTLQHTATHCNTLQHTATHCNTCLNWLVKSTF